MAKSIIKEIFLTVLLLVAVILIFVLLFYEDNPITKVVPDEITYTTPAGIRNELGSSKSASGENSLNSTDRNVVFEVQGADLNEYKEKKTYIPGKSNPFVVWDETQAAQNEIIQQQEAANAIAAAQNKTSNTTIPPETPAKTTNTTNTTTTFWNTVGSK